MAAPAPCATQPHIAFVDASHMYACRSAAGPLVAARERALLVWRAARLSSRPAPTPDSSRRSKRDGNCCGPPPRAGTLVPLRRPHQQRPLQPLPPGLASHPVLCMHVPHWLPFCTAAWMPIAGRAGCVRSYAPSAGCSRCAAGCAPSVADGVRRGSGGAWEPSARRQARARSGPGVLHAHLRQRGRGGASARGRARIVTPASRPPLAGAAASSPAQRPAHPPGVPLDWFDSPAPPQLTSLEKPPAGGAGGGAAVLNPPAPAPRPPPGWRAPAPKGAGRSLRWNPANPPAKPPPACAPAPPPPAPPPPGPPRMPPLRCEGGGGGVSACATLHVRLACSKGARAGHAQSPLTRARRARAARGACTALDQPTAHPGSAHRSNSGLTGRRGARAAPGSCGS